MAKSCYARFSAKRFEMLVRKGWTDQECADFFDLNIDTITTWKKKHPEFSASLKNWKESADYHVEKSLYERAMGYSHKAIKMFVIGGKIVQQEYIEHYPPDSTSLIFWLKNRQPERWREKEAQSNPGGTQIFIVRDGQKTEIKAKEEVYVGREISFNSKAEQSI